MVDARGSRETPTPGRASPHPPAPARRLAAAGPADAGWVALGASVRGAAHTRAGLANQDAIGWVPDTAFAAARVLAIADGHGATEATRSAIGARLAVETALRVLAGAVGPPDRDAAEALTLRLCIAWRAAVKQHVRHEPLCADELGQLGRQPAIRAYGTTVLAAAIGSEEGLLLQIGDGDVLLVMDDGAVVHPLPADARLVANATTSLAGARPWTDFRVGLCPLRPTPPALILLATDGYANAFHDDRAFAQVGADLLDLLRGHGIAPIARQLPAWLEEASTLGSGDDVTLGLLVRGDVVPAAANGELTVASGASR